MRASTQAIASLAQIADELTFDAGEEVFALGHGERALFVIVRGVLALTQHVEGAQRVTRVGPARSLATSAALSGQLGQYSARAETAAILLRIREEEKLLRAQFGADYDAYAARVKRFVPGVI